MKAIQNRSHQHRYFCSQVFAYLLVAYVLSKWAEVKEIWNGANARDLQAGWQWSDSAPFNYFNWEAGRFLEAGNSKRGARRTATFILFSNV